MKKVVPLQAYSAENGVITAFTMRTLFYKLALMVYSKDRKCIPN